MLQMTNIEKHFGKTHVLKGVSLNVAKGEKVALIGPSGSGKTTLLRCINFLEEFDGGTAELEGRSIGFKLDDGRRTRIGEREVANLRCDIGMVFQSYNLFPHLTVMRNLTLAPTKVRRRPLEEVSALAREMLCLVGLEHKADNYPSQLSGGQQQRVAIARALVMQPKMMLFDEVTSALDPELVGEVLSAMKDLAARGMTMVIVTHEMEFAKNVADKVVFMENGLIVEQGPPSKLFSEPDSPRLRQFLKNYMDRSR